MRIVTYDRNGELRAGLLLEGIIVDIAERSGNRSYAKVRGLLDDWNAALPWLKTLEEKDGTPVGAAGLLLAAPLAEPTAIYCAGANYRDHVENMSIAQNLPVPPNPHEVGAKPWHFLKSANCIVGPDAAVTCRSSALDWEAELAVVIGRKARDVSVEDALSIVAGYMIGNDLSARDRITRAQADVSSPFRYDWVGHKNFDGSCPLGPWLVSADDIGDPQNLSIRLWVNDILRQDSNTAKMLFTVAEQIAQLSSSITLHPGDVILTGTPAGVGAETGIWLNPGDVIKIQIEQLGELVTRIV